MVYLEMAMALSVEEYLPWNVSLVANTRSREIKASHYKQLSAVVCSRCNKLQTG